MKRPQVICRLSVGVVHEFNRSRIFLKNQKIGHRSLHQSATGERNFGLPHLKESMPFLASRPIQGMVFVQNLSKQFHGMSSTACGMKNHPHMIIILSPSSCRPDASPKCILPVEGSSLAVGWSSRARMLRLRLSMANSNWGFAPEGTVVKADRPSRRNT